MAFPVWLIGVLLAVVSAIISNLGLNLQKRNHLNNSASLDKAGEDGKKGGHHVHHHSSSHHRHRHRGTSAHRARREKERHRRKHRVQPNDILVKAPSAPPATLEQPHADEEAASQASPVGSLEAKRRRRKRRAAAVGEGDKAELGPLLTVRVQSADEVGIQELLSASSSYFLHPSPSHVEPSPSPTASSADEAAPPAAPPASTAASDAASRGGGHSSPDDAAEAINYTRQLTWQCGLALVILGSLFDFAALAFASQSQIAPLGSLTLVSNVFLAPLLLKETLSRRDVVCTLVIVAGAFLAVLCAAHDDGALTVGEMFSYFLHLQFALYAAVVLVAVLALRVMTWKAGLLRRRAHTSREAARRYQAGMRFHRFGYAAAAGIMGAQSVLFAKCTSTLVRATVSGQGVMFLFPGTYAVLTGLGVTIFFQIRWLNSGLRLFPALYIVPVFQSFWILVSVISGMVFFQEWQGVLDEPLMALGFCSGLVLTIGGVYVLSQKAGHDREGDHSAAETEGAGEAEKGRVGPGVLEVEASSSALQRRDSASSTSSLEAFAHHRSRSLSGDRDFDDGGHGRPPLLHLHLHPSAQSAFKQPLLQEEEEKVGQHAAHLGHVTPTRTRRHPTAASPPLANTASPSSSTAATSSAFIAYLPPYHHAAHHHLSPLPESLTPSNDSALRQRVDSDPVERHRRLERGESAPLPSPPSSRFHQPTRAALLPPAVEVEPVLPSYSFSHPNEFLQVPSSPAVPAQRSRSASIGHIGEEILSVLGRRGSNKGKRSFDLGRALSALVSPSKDDGVPPPSPPSFRRPSWVETSHEAALHAPGLSAFAHAIMLRNYERSGGREDEDDSPGDARHDSGASDDSSQSSDAEDGDEEGEDDDDDGDDDEEDSDGDEDEEEGSAARLGELRSASALSPQSSLWGGVHPRPPLPSSASAVASAPPSAPFAFPSLPSSSSASAASPTAAVARPPLTEQHRIRLPAARRGPR